MVFTAIAFCGNSLLYVLVVHLRICQIDIFLNLFEPPGHKNFILKKIDKLKSYIIHLVDLTLRRSFCHLVSIIQVGFSLFELVIVGGIVKPSIVLICSPCNINFTMVTMTTASFELTPCNHSTHRTV